jgi:hypothetical protein
MDFNKLYNKIYLMENSAVIDECPCEETGAPPAHEQPENVNMSISINGQGENSIRSIMDVLKNLDGDFVSNKSAEFDQDNDPFALGNHDMAPDELDGDDEILLGDEPEFDVSDNDEFAMLDDFANSLAGGSDTKTFGMDSVIRKGNDLSSKGLEAPKQAGGGNPWNMSETALRERLTKLYASMK